MNNLKYSIIIPTLNQSRKLSQCLDRLSCLLFDPCMFEVLVIDNGSSDDTKAVSLSFQEKIRNLRYVYCAAPGLMAARHMGCDEACGQILCFIDDDSLVDKDWLNGIDAAFKQERAALVGGPCLPEYEVTPPDWINYFWSPTPYGRIHSFLSLVDFGDKVRLINPMYVFGCNYSIKKNIFLELGGTYPDYYPENYRYFQGDGESGLSAKIKKTKYIVIYHPKAKIRHLIPSARLTGDYFCWRRYFNGIHSSYTAVRRQYGADGPVVQEKVHILWRLTQKTKTLLGLKTKQKSRANIDEPNEIASIREKIEESYKSGYQDHQKEIKNDPVLLEWVLRENYLGDNGRLPK